MITLNVLITGGSGFVGKYLSKELLHSLDCNILGVSRSAGQYNGSKSPRWSCDILDKDKLKQLLEEYKPDLIFHLAAPAFIPDSLRRPRETYNIIFNGTLNLLESVKELGLKSKILYVSSADIYGDSKKAKLQENDPFNPINPYASGKACGELLCSQFYNSYGIPTIIARPFNHTGPGQSIDFVCSNFAYQIVSMEKQNQKEMTLHTGNVDVERDFLDVRDVVKAYIQLLMIGKPGEVYNISSGVGISIRRVIDLLVQESQIDKCIIEIDPLKLRQNEIMVRTGDNSKLINNTQWKPVYPLEQTLTDLYAYWREQI